MMANLTAKEAIKNFQKTFGYTNEAIIKALECCKGSNKNCEGCVLCDDKGCDDNLKQIAADRIRDLKSEVDAVVSAVDNITKEFLKLHDDYQEAKRELEELKKDRYQILPDGRVELIPRSDVKALKKEVEMLRGALEAEERHNELTMEMAKKAIENAKADVVPKSEVELYRKQVDELEDELAQTYDKLENAKAEVAREIFEEIEKVRIISRACEKRGITYDFSEFFAELKKKYTEE